MVTRSPADNVLTGRHTALGASQSTGVWKSTGFMLIEYTQDLGEAWLEAGRVPGLFGALFVLWCHEQEGIFAGLEFPLGDGLRCNILCG